MEEETHAGVRPSQQGTEEQGYTSEPPTREASTARLRTRNGRTTTENPPNLVLGVRPPGTSGCGPYAREGAEHHSAKAGTMNAPGKGLAHRSERKNL